MYVCIYSITYCSYQHNRTSCTLFTYLGRSSVHITSTGNFDIFGWPTFFLRKLVPGSFLLGCGISLILVYKSQQTNGLREHRSANVNTSTKYHSDYKTDERLFVGNRPTIGRERPMRRSRAPWNNIVSPRLVWARHVATFRNNSTLKLVLYTVPLRVLRWM